MRKIIVKNPTKRAFGNEYPVCYYKGGRLVHKTYMFGSDIKWADRAYTKEFQGTKIERPKRHRK